MGLRGWHPGRAAPSPAPLLPYLLPSASGPVWKQLSPFNADFNWENEGKKGVGKY